MKMPKAILPLRVMICLLAVVISVGIRAEDPTPTPTPTPSASSTPAPTPAAADTDTLELSGKDPARGTFLGWDKDGVHWRDQHAREPAVYALSDVMDVKLGSAAQPSGAAKPAYLVSLANDDEIPAAAIAFDGKTLSLDTTCAGKLSIPREKAVSITVFNNNVLYAGPSGADGLDGWTDSPLAGAGQKTWDYKNGEFVPTGRTDGVISRDVGLAPMSRVEFDLSPGKRGSIGVNLYSGDRGAGCQLLFIFYTRPSRGNVQLDRYDPAAAQKVEFLQQSAALNTANTAKMHVDIRANRDAKTVALYVDGKFVVRFSDPGMFGGTDGSGIAFYTARDSAAHLSNIKVTIWDGLDTDAPGQKDSTAPQTDTLAIANGDRISGKLKSIADGKIDIESSLSEMTVAIEKVVRINFAGAQPAGAPPAGGTTGLAAATPAYDPAAPIRATLVGGGSITLQIDSWDEKQVNATSPIFGKVVFPASIFGELKYLPNAPDPALDPGPPANGPLIQPRMLLNQ